MALKKSELYSSLWSSCDQLRGGMDASQYKDYVLVLLFIKYVSDKYAGVPYAPISIPPGSNFKDMVALKGKPRHRRPDRQENYRAAGQRLQAVGHAELQRPREARPRQGNPVFCPDAILRFSKRSAIRRESVQPPPGAASTFPQHDRPLARPVSRLADGLVPRRSAGRSLPHLTVTGAAGRWTLREGRDCLLAPVGLSAGLLIKIAVIPALSAKLSLLLEHHSWKESPALTLITSVILACCKPN